MGRIPGTLFEARDAQKRSRLSPGPNLPPPGSLSGNITFSSGSGCRVVELASLSVDSAETGRCVELSEVARATEPTPTVHAGDGVLLDATDFVSGLQRRNAAPIQALGHDRRIDGLTAVVAHVGSRTAPRRLYESRLAGHDRSTGIFALAGGGALPELALELWQGHRLVSSVPLPNVGYPVFEHPVGEIVRFGPDGQELAAASGGDDSRLVVVDLRSGRVVLGPVRQRAFAWSPDGAWLALAGEESIEIYGPTRADPVYTLPVEAGELAWHEG